jgi:capsule biosynthesis phosphatase
MNRIVIDLDGTIARDDPGRAYPDREPDYAVIERLAEYRELGFQICVMTSRNMRTYEGNVGAINVHTLPGIIAWLDKAGVPYDEIVVGKPWCGNDGFYVDDRALRPDEFARLSPADVAAMLDHKPSN